MFTLTFRISNPFSKRWDSIKTWHGSTPFPNKFWEVQLMKTGDVIFIDFGITSRTDHAGFTIELGLLGFNTSFVVYDNRHWDKLGECWEKPKNFDKS